MDEENIDYCTLFPDKLFGYDISQCCKAHDEAYVGVVPKYEADVQLFECVKERSDGVVTLAIAAVMFLGVSAFGFMFYKRK